MFTVLALVAGVLVAGWAIDRLSERVVRGHVDAALDPTLGDPTAFDHLLSPDLAADVARVERAS